MGQLAQLAHGQQNCVCVCAFLGSSARHPKSLKALRVISCTAMLILINQSLIDEAHGSELLTVIKLEDARTRAFAT